MLVAAELEFDLTAASSLRLTSLYRRAGMARLRECDRCGQQYRGADADNAIRVASVEVGTNTKASRDLCQNCANELVKWLERIPAAGKD
jgi:hypothetical protein